MCIVCLLNVRKWHKSSFMKAVWGVTISTKMSGFLIQMKPEVLTCVREAGNDADHYSVAMINCSMTVVGHELLAEEKSLGDSVPCGLETAESRLK